LGNITDSQCSVSAELQQVASLRQPSLKEKILGTLSGSTMGDDGVVQHASIFDFFDFMDLNFGQATELQIIPAFHDIAFHVCLETSDDELPVYQLDKVRELVLLRRSELIKARGQPTPMEEVEIEKEVTKIVTYFHIGNLVNMVSASRLRFLQAWTQLVLLMLQTSEFDDTARGKLFE
jgi:nuclear pore complex protein Nup205